MSEHLIIDNKVEIGSTHKTHLLTSQVRPVSRAITSPRQIILEAVEALELEVTRWKEANETAVEELENLRRENTQLLQQFEITKEERDAANRRIQSLDEENRRLQEDAKRYKEAFELESKRVIELEEIQQKRNDFENEETQKLRDTLGRKMNELKTVCQEREIIRIKLEKATNQKLDDRSFELLHEAEVLRRELQSVRSSKEELMKVNASLLVEIRNLETVLSDRELQLRNETMRHSLLTTQFNSLMEENAALKEKQHVKTMQRYCEKNPTASEGTATSSSGTVVGDQEPVRQGYPGTVIAIKASERRPSVELRRRYSFNSVANSRGSKGSSGGLEGGLEERRGSGDSTDRSRQNTSRGKNFVDSNKNAHVSDELRQAVRNAVRRSQTVPGIDPNQTGSYSPDGSIRSSSLNTLPLLVRPNSGNQWKP